MSQGPAGADGRTVRLSRLAPGAMAAMLKALGFDMIGESDLKNYRIDDLLDALPRSLFLASPDLNGIISGRSIPTRAAVKHILTQLILLGIGSKVMVIGSGAGYLPAVLSRMVKELVVVEFRSAVADIARRNFERAKVENVRLILGEGALGAPDLGPFDLIFVCARLDGMQQLREQVVDGGNVVCLEGDDPLVPVLAVYARTRHGFKRRELGRVSLVHDVGEFMIDLGYIEEAQLMDAREESRQLREPVISVLRRRFPMPDGEFYDKLADQYGLRLMTADKLLKHIDLSLFKRFSKTFLDNHRIVPIQVRDGVLYVASDNPDVVTDDLARMRDFQTVITLLVTPTDFRRIWSVIDLSTRGKEILPQRPTVQEPSPRDDLLDNSTVGVTPYLISLYESILLDAVSAKASDIHVERYGDRIRLRIRVDGELHDVTHYQLTPRDHAGLINVIKVRGEIDIAERRLPQGGRSNMRVGATNYDLRIQVQPSLHGEHVVIRLLSQTGRVLSLKELGMSERVAGFYQRLLSNPTGLVLVVGPTGSGKSTTLYAALQELADNGHRKVITVEDPIEYAIDNIQQTRARPEIGFNFADAMRSFVRQDPDVILVGEIRDPETAREAMRASQTGHLVLSTLHSNDAVGALQRLYDLGVLPNSIAGELLAIIAQRLARRICEYCREPDTPDPAIMKELFPDRTPANFRCFKGKGCKQCNGFGTKGRIAVVEYLQVDDDIRRIISLQPPAGELRWHALDAGLITMRDSALEHVINGVIPIDELPRILPQDRMRPEIRGGRRTEP